MSTQDEINRLHAEYLRLVGGGLTLTLDRMYWWGQWTAKGLCIEDLRTVIGHIQAQIKKGKRFEGALRWSRLIQQSDVFEEELILANAEKRNAKPHIEPKQRVLEQARPTAEPERPTIVSGDTCKRVDYWIEQLRKAAE